jgi:hypothetical protein
LAGFVAFVALGFGAGCFAFFSFTPFPAGFGGVIDFCPAAFFAALAPRPRVFTPDFLSRREVVALVIPKDAPTAFSVLPFPYIFSAAFRFHLRIDISTEGKAILFACLYTGRLHLVERRPPRCWTAGA